MAKKTYLRKGYTRKAYTRKGGVKVKTARVSATRVRFPKLSEEERKRRADRALKILLPAAIKWVGEVGFEEAARRLAKKAGITDAEKLAGWLKGQAKKMGVLSPKHPYVGRKGYRKYPEAAKRLSQKEYQRYLRAMREKKKS